MLGACTRKESLWCTDSDFRKLAPPLADSQKSIEAIRLLPEAERNFNPFPPSPSLLSSSNMSDSSKVPILLDLEELDRYPLQSTSRRELLLLPAPNRSRLLSPTRELALPPPRRGKVLSLALQALKGSLTKNSASLTP
ncbi:hypothetical protein HanLR1_Chr06g0224581 [Helianthus annuus]|nr:hypothetical protein HanHA89_Chr06g0240681 [Helianthus annuus]KAJ0738987.1 hypothetical protein HanLR1_Chr06g0224581 [Helianthus annuus]